MEQDGIDFFKFVVFLILFGLVFEDDVYWISFYGGYDFGYLIKFLMFKNFFGDEGDFDEEMKRWFFVMYDVKYLMKYVIKFQNSGQFEVWDFGVVDILIKFEQKVGFEYIVEIFKIK